MDEIMHCRIMGKNCLKVSVSDEDRKNYIYKMWINNPMEGFVKGNERIEDGINYLVYYVDTLKPINAVYKEGSCPREYAENFIKMLSCICPHVGEEIWQILGHDNTLAFEPWPSYDESKCVEDTVEIAVQINGKVKATLNIGKEDPKDEVIAKGKELIADKLEGKTVVKEIYVPGRIVNIVVK